jgi:hypothetical protein
MTSADATAEELASVSQISVIATERRAPGIAHGNRPPVPIEVHPKSPSHHRLELPIADKLLPAYRKGFREPFTETR